MSLEQSFINKVVEAALMAAGQPLSLDKLHSLFNEQIDVEKDHIKQALDQLSEDFGSRGVELKEVSSGYRIQAKQDFAPWLAKLWEEKPPRYSRAVLETMVLIAYRQPITRGEIEDVRGVSVSSHIIKSLLERDWVRVVGHRDVPGRPALYATTKGFLDYFNLKSLDELPSLSEIKDLDSINVQLNLAPGDADATLNNSDAGAAPRLDDESPASEGNATVAAVALDAADATELAQVDADETSGDKATNQAFFKHRLPAEEETSDALDAVDAALLSTKDVLERFERAVFRKDQDIDAEESDLDVEDMLEEQAISDAVESLTHEDAATDAEDMAFDDAITQDREWEMETLAGDNDEFGNENETGMDSDEDADMGRRHYEPAEN